MNPKIEHARGVLRRKDWAGNDAEIDALRSALEDLVGQYDEETVGGQERGGAFHREEVSSIYVDENERFVVSLIVGYGDGDDVESADVAAAAALALTCDLGATGTVWHVCDRESGTMHQFEQGDFMDLDVR